MLIRNLLFIFLILLCSSCKKEENNPSSLSNVKPPLHLINEVTYYFTGDSINQIHRQIYEYDDTGRIAFINSSDSVKILNGEWITEYYHVIFEFTDFGKLARIRMPYSPYTTITFNYDANQKLISSYFSQSAYRDTTNFNVQNDILVSINKHSTRTTLTYYTTCPDSILVTNYPNNTREFLTTFSHSQQEDRNAVFFQNIYPYPLHTKELLSETYIDYSRSVIKLTTYEWTYNLDRYPIKKITRVNGSKTSETTFTYRVLKK